MLEALGVSAFDEEVYRAVLALSRASVATLAVAQSESVGRIAAAVRRLRAAGLLERRTVGGVLVPVDPRVALSALERQRRQELDGLSAVAADLTAAFHTRSLRTEPDRLVQVVDGSADVARWFDHLVKGAREEVLVLHASPPTIVEYPAEEQAALLRSGVRIRVVYGVEELAQPGRLEQVRRDMAAGEEARTLPDVPLKLLVVDRRRAFLPLGSDGSGLRDGAIVVELSSLTEALVRLFEMLWERAVPLARHAGGQEAGLTDADSTLLALLQAGLKDDAIMRQLGISERTLRRRIGDLLDRLGATSRFQAGAQAARLGWI